MVKDTIPTPPLKSLANKHAFLYVMYGGLILAIDLDNTRWQ